MAGHRPFSELRVRMSPERRARSEREANQLLARMRLDELRESLDLNQTIVGDALGVKQAAVSRLERRADMLVSTLRDYVTALGGELEIVARFPEGDVRINQFDEAQIYDPIK